jgi:hypothetical protein
MSFDARSSSKRDAQHELHLAWSAGTNGRVATPMEKQIAETKVRTNVTAFNVTNDLQVEELG